MGLPLRRLIVLGGLVPTIALGGQPPPALKYDTDIIICKVEDAPKTSLADAECETLGPGMYLSDETLGVLNLEIKRLQAVEATANQPQPVPETASPGFSLTPYLIVAGVAFLAGLAVGGYVLLQTSGVPR